MELLDQINQNYDSDGSSENDGSRGKGQEVPSLHEKESAAEVAGEGANRAEKDENEEEGKEGEHGKGSEDEEQKSTE